MAHKAEYKFLDTMNMDIYLKSLNDCILRRFGKVQVDMLMAGGSALIVGHNFRIYTENIDAFIKSSVDISICIDEVSSMHSLPSDWINSDFTKSPSFSAKLSDHADFIKSYGVLNVYKICDLDLLCTKLVSYSDKDKVDIEGLVTDNPILTKEAVDNELSYLYGDCDNLISYDARVFLMEQLKK